jgi:hypothetical protein
LGKEGFAKMSNRSKIIQIIPAVGWYAKFEVESGISYDPLISWALIGDDKDRTVVGIVADREGPLTEYAEAISNFLGYAHREDA